MKKLNNKGFTLVEVLAVLVILVVIMSIAIPNISSSMERSKSKQNDARMDLLITYAELYVSDNRSKISTSECYISKSNLTDGGYATEEDFKDADGNSVWVGVKYTKSSNLYTVVTSLSTPACVSY